MSAAQTTASLAQVKRQYAFFIGVAGSLKDAALGDVVFATLVHVVKEKGQWSEDLTTHKDSAADLITFIRNHYDDAIAVEMEGLGFYEGLRYHREVLGAVIPGISDCVDNKEHLNDSVQPEASLHAARFMVALLEGLAELGQSSPRA